MLKRFILGAAMAAATTTAANAAFINVDGVRDANYGAATATVAADPDAITSNFGTPGTTNAVGYDIYLQGADGYVYGYLEADTATGLTFANLYFNVDLTNNVGSDIGFHITSKDAFIPVNGGFSATPDIVVSSGANFIEFAIPVQYFMSYLPGLDYATNMSKYDLPALGAKVQLSLSQSFGYSVAGGVANYGADRLGEVTLSPAPEPSTWAMMLLGFLGAGSAIRMRRRVMVRA
jgi:hypothetical protein